jgi:transcription antitermination factor NusA-like protein
MGLVEVYVEKKHAFLPAKVLDIKGDKCECEFLVSGKRTMVNMQSVRLAPELVNTRYKDKDLVEVCCKSDEEPGGGHNDAQCWWEAEISAVKGEFCHIHYTGWDKSFDEIVELVYLRPSTGLPERKLSFEKHDVPVKANLKSWIQHAANLDGVKTKSGAWALSVKNPKAKNLSLTLLGTKTSAETAMMLLQLHSKHQDQLHSLEVEASKLQEEKEARQEQYGNSVHDSFQVDRELIGAIVGPKGSHIKKAERESGVHSAYVEDSRVVIHGPDQQSVDDCRALLEIVKDEVEVEANMLGWIIGKKGSNIREMEQETGVIKIRVIENTVEFVGTKQAVMKGKLWLETHTKYLEEFGNARSKVDESYQEFVDVERLHGGSRGGKGARGRGEGGKGRGGAKGKGRGGAVPDRRERKPYQGDSGDFPGLPRPAPRDNAGNDKPPPKPSGKGGDKPKPKPRGAAPEGAETVEVSVKAGGRGRGGRGKDVGGRGRGGRGKGNNKSEAMPAPKNAKETVDVSIPKPQRDRARKPEAKNEFASKE